MIVTDKYAIGHIPKTGGDAAKSLFRAAEIPGLRIIDGPPKHWYFEMHSIERPIHVLTVRRLPSRELSEANHFLATGGTPKDTPKINRLWTPDELIELARSEKYLTNMSAVKPIGVFLRSESLVDDIQEFIRRLHVHCPDLSRVRTKQRLNYDHDIWKWCTKDQVRRMYAAHPTWAEMELKVYGSLLE